MDLENAVRRNRTERQDCKDYKDCKDEYVVMRHDVDFEAPSKAGTVAEPLHKRNANLIERAETANLYHPSLPPLFHHLH